MIARVRLDLALRKEFDYLVPSEFAGQVEVGTRVKVPFGPRQVMGSVIDVVETSPHTNLRPIAKVLGRQALITPEILRLARWIAEYYCCRLEVASAGWRLQPVQSCDPWRSSRHTRGGHSTARLRCSSRPAWSGSRASIATRSSPSSRRSGDRLHAAGRGVGVRGTG